MGEDEIQAVKEDSEIPFLELEMMARITLKEIKISYTRRCHSTRMRVKNCFAGTWGEVCDGKIRGLFLILLNMRSSHFQSSHERGEV